MSVMMDEIKQAIRKNLKDYLHALEGEKPAKCFLDDMNESMEKILIEQLLILLDNNQKKAADYLGIHRNTLSRKIRHLRIRID